MRLNEWFSPLLYTAITAFFTTIWWTFPPTEHLNTNGYGMLLASFSLSALVEGLAEPLAILSLKTAENGHFAIANAVLNFLQRVVVLALLLAGSDAITAFCVAQVSSNLETCTHAYAPYACIRFRCSVRWSTLLSISESSSPDRTPEPWYGRQEPTAAATTCATCD